MTKKEYVIAVGGMYVVNWTQSTIELSVTQDRRRKMTETEMKRLTNFLMALDVPYKIRTITTTVEEE